MTLGDLLKNSNYTLQYIAQAFAMTPELIQALQQAQVDLAQVSTNTLTYTYTSVSA